MMALSRFTPWFAVSALMPLGSSSTHSLHLDSRKYKCYVKASLFIFIYPSFEVHAYIFLQQIKLVYLRRRLSGVVSEILGNQMQLVHYLQMEGEISNKGVRSETV